MLSLFHISRTIYFSYDLCRNHNRNIFVAAADITKLQYNIRTMYVRQTYESYGVRKLDVRKNKINWSHGSRAEIVRQPYKFSRLPQDCRKDILSFVRPPHDKHELARLPHGVRATTVGVISTCPDLGIYKKGWWQHSFSAADLGGVNNGDPGTYVARCSHDTCGGRAR